MPFKVFFPAIYHPALPTYIIRLFLFHLHPLNSSPSLLFFRLPLPPSINLPLCSFVPYSPFFSESLPIIHSFGLICLPTSLPSCLTSSVSLPLCLSPTLTPSSLVSFPSCFSPVFPPCLYPAQPLSLPASLFLLVSFPPCLSHALPRSGALLIREDCSSLVTS